MRFAKGCSPLLVLFTALAGVAALPALAQPDDDDIQQTVARVAYVSGTVSYNRGDDPDDWQPAGINFPMTLGDRIYTGGESRVELQMAGASAFLAPRTDLAALNFTRSVRQLSMIEGTASFRVRWLHEDEAFEIDTPNAAVTLDGPGEYRVDVDEEGTTKVSVSRGSALVSAAGGEVSVRAGDQMEIWGIDQPTYDIYALPRRDSWDYWVETRARRARDSRSVQYVSNEVFGADDLDSYGSWEEIPDYGRCWAPSSVSVDWAPYRVGHWVWQDPWGWTWISEEPWGWAPYHWGRWVTVRSRWFWVPVAPSVRIATYSPALVAFVGGGVAVTGGYVGWFPLAPRDPFNPWWGARHREVNVTNVTYVNRTYVTVVNQNTFVSGQVVAPNVVRETTVVRRIGDSPVARGPVPVLPTRTSLRVSTVAVTNALPRPRVQTLAVVSRLAPPPAPPTFAAKVTVINQSRGVPVGPQAAARISVESRGGAHAVMPIRPVVTEAGRVELRAKESRANLAAPTEVRAKGGRVLSTADRPLVAEPRAASRSDSSAAPRVAPGAVVTGHGDQEQGGKERLRREAGGPPEARGNQAGGQNQGQGQNQNQNQGQGQGPGQGGPPDQRSLERRRDDSRGNANNQGRDNNQGSDKQARDAQIARENQLRENQARDAADRNRRALEAQQARDAQTARENQARENRARDANVGRDNNQGKDNNQGRDSGQVRDNQPRERREAPPRVEAPPKKEVPARGQQKEKPKDDKNKDKDKDKKDERQ